MISVCPEKLPVPVRAYLLIATLIQTHPEKSYEEIYTTLKNSVSITMGQLGEVSSASVPLLDAFSRDADVLIEAFNMFEDCFTKTKNNLNG